MSIDEIGYRCGHRLWLRYKGESGILRYVRQFHGLWNADVDALYTHKLALLQRLLKHAFSTCRYYRQRFRECQFDATTVASIDDIRQLPFLTKDDLNQRMQDILSAAYSRSELSQSSTGGSSGIPLSFYRDREVTMVRRAQDYFFNEMIGIRPGMRRALVWGSPLDGVSRNGLKAKVANALSERAIRFNSFDATQETMGAFLAQLREWKPHAILAYPNMLAAIAEQAIEKRLCLPRVPKVIVTAEPVYGWQRELFRTAFGAETFERYGSREIGTVAAEMDDHKGMYIFEPNYLIEIADNQGGQVQAGEMGELVVTDLHNLAMPLIRYRTGDMVRLAETVNKKGISCWRRLAAVAGREVDLIVRADGSRIAGEAMIRALRTCGVRQKVQLVQKAVNSIEIRHLESDQIAPGVKAALQEQLDRILKLQVQLTFVGVRKLEYDKSGKYRYVTSYCSRKCAAVDR